MIDEYWNIHDFPNDDFHAVVVHQVITVSLVHTDCPSFRPDSIQEMNLGAINAVFLVTLLSDHFHLI